MMRRISALVLCAAGPAHAETRLDLAPIPDLSVLEHVYSLDRYDDSEWCGTGRSSNRASATLGVGNDDAAGAASFAWGIGGREALTLGLGTELMATQHAFTRGRGRLHAGISTGDEEDFSLKLEVGGALDHGLAPGLAPLAAGGGRRTIAGARSRALVQLSDKRSDFVWVAAIDGTVTGTAWDDAPMTSALQRSVGLALGRAVADGELPRGAIDLIRGRVSQVEIERSLIAAGAVMPSVTNDVRIVELGLGPKDLTLHFDRDLLGVIDVDLGWSWLEAGALADDMFRMRLASALAWVDDRSRRTELGIGIAREPTHTADGARLVSEWRVALSMKRERARHVIDASGGISWGSVKAGGNPAETLTRYGTQLEAFAKLGHGLEAGGYYATWFEPPGAGDPWMLARRWTIESGLALRLRR